MAETHENGKRERIVIDLPPGEPASAEVLWGASVGTDLYELQNVPIWAYGIGYEDIVEADTRDDGRLHFKKILKKSGLLTVRAAGPQADQAAFDELCDMLQGRAIATEKYSRSYVAFAMEPESLAPVESEMDRAAAAAGIEVEIANQDE